MKHGVLRMRLPLIVEGLLMSFAAVILAVWLHIEFRPRVVEFSLPVTRVMPDITYSYVATIPNPALGIFFKIIPDTGDAPRASSLELYEDSNPLGPPHWSRDNVRKFGLGTYLHRRRGLYFSSSDNSSPITNGRKYSVRANLTPTALTRWFGVTALIILFWRVFVCLPPAYQKAIATQGREVLRWAVTPAQFGQNGFAASLIALVVVCVSWYYLYALWKSGNTVNLAVGGFFQVSDSSGYAACANQVLDEGVRRPRVAEYFAGWCLRRPTYSSFLATILSITGRNWFWTFFVQSAFVAISITVLLRAAARFIGPIAAFLVLCVMLSFATEHGYPFTLTENLGLALGAVGLALSLDGVRMEDRRLLFLGTACFSLGLNARAGAFLALPLLVAAFLFQSTSWRSRWLTSTIVMVGITSGFALHFFSIAYLGGPSGASHSNFAHTLYGLSLGGKGWNQVYKDYPEIFQKYTEAQAGRLIYGIALTHITNSPLLFVKALTKNLFEYLRDLSLGMFSLRLIWWVGVLAIVLRWRDPPYRMIGFLSIGVVISTPFIYQDGGARVFASTWGITGLQVGVGLHLLLGWLRRFFNDSRAHDNIQRFAPHGCELVVAICLIATILLPLTPVRSFAAIKPISPQGCPPGEKELIARLGRESYMIVLVVEDPPNDFWHMQVSAKKLLKNIGGIWFDQDFAALPVPSTLIHGYQIMEGHVGDDIRLIWKGDLGELYGKTASLCYRSDESVSIAENPYHRAVTVRLVGP